MRGYIICAYTGRKEQIKSDYSWDGERQDRIKVLLIFLLEYDKIGAHSVLLISAHLSAGITICLLFSLASLKI